MESKKISFGFMKTKKAEKPVVEEKKDFIECVEEKSIKVVGGEEIKEVTPLVIPMKPNTLVTAERLKQIAEKVESALEEPEIVDKPMIPQEKPSDNETLDQMAVRELLQDVKKEVSVETPMMTVPLPAKPVNEGEKESSLDDYEAVPVQDFGLAMLRGMGWAPNKEKSTYKPPQLRPKGLGLGADKVVKGNQKQKSNKDGKDEDLTIVKNAYVRITTGKYNGYYGKVVSLDEDNGRVMVDLAVKKETVSLSEFMMHPVSKSEFDKESKVINAGSYEEYKKKGTVQKSTKNSERESTPEKKKNDRSNREEKYSEREATSSKNSDSKYDKNETSSRHIEKDRSSKNGKDYRDDEEDRKERDRDRLHRSKQRRDSTEERSGRKKDKRYSSSESLDFLSDSEKKRDRKKEKKRYSSQDSLSSQSDKDRKKRNTKKERKRHESSDSESDHRSKRNKTPEGKRDIDKKRKGKKKKRDRDRSPNYRKHRK